MKTICILKNAVQSILLAGMMLGIAGIVQAQAGITGEAGGRMAGKSGAMEASDRDSSMAGKSSSERGSAITGQPGVPPVVLPNKSGPLQKRPLTPDTRLQTIRY